MVDTAQPLAAETDPNAQLASAANAFKAFDNPASVQPRGPDGKWVDPNADATDEQPVETDDELETAEAETGEVEELEEDEQEAAEPAQPMPPSWPAEKAEQWAQLPADAQAIIAEREAERDRGLNLKMQESANARKEATLAAQEAQTKRQEYLTALETVEALYSVQKPDPRAFGYGTPQYNAAAYATAHAEYEQTSQALAQFQEQRTALQKQAADEEAQAFRQWKQQHEAEYAPKLLADVPDLKDNAKAEPLLRELVTYAIQQGVPEDVFAEEAQEQITSAQLHILWKAQQFDKMRATPAAQPKPRQAGPAVRPGVSSPRSAQKAVRQQKASDRLAREGSIDAGAAVWKSFL